MTDEPHLDDLDHPFRVGDYVTYAVTSGRSAVLKYGRIVKMTHQDPSYGGKQRMAKIQMVTAHTGWDRDWKIQGPSVDKPRIITTFIRCAVILDGNRFPPKAKALLDQAWDAYQEKHKDGD